MNPMTMCNTYFKETVETGYSYALKPSQHYERLVRVTVAPAQI